MNTLEKQDIQQLIKVIDQVKEASINDIMLIANTENQAKMFEEMLPGVKVLCAYGLGSDDKVYIMPCDEKPIKIIYN